MTFKNLLAVTIALLMSINSFGQETKKVTKKISRDETEVYFSLKSDPNVKQGSYQLIKQKTVRVSGQYVANQKDGLWTEYQYTGKRISTGNYTTGVRSGPWTFYRTIGNEEKVWYSGNLKDDKRVGLWNFFDKDGILIQQFDYSTELVKSVNEEKAFQNKLVFGGKYDGLVFVDEIPKFVDGDESLFKSLSGNINYPPNARNEGLEGVVYVQAKVTIEGNLMDYSIIRGVSNELDEEAIRVLSLTNGRWKPAVFNGEEVVSTLTMPFRFVLNR